MIWKEEQYEKIITISREFGAGGGEIGRKVAERLGYHYYDKELILRSADTSKVDVEYASLGRESSGQFRICPEPV